jgi:hypothetical protein
LPIDAINDAIKKLHQIEGSSLYECNFKFTQMLQYGIEVQYTDAKHQLKTAIVNLIDYDHEDENDFDHEYPLADFGIDSAGLYKIRDEFITALKKNEPYFDFRTAYVQTFEDPEAVLKRIEETYDK